MIPSAVPLPGADALNARFEAYRADVCQPICAYWALRACLGPVMETLVLLDRLLYAREHGYDTQCTMLFDPQVSPRAYALVATRTPTT